MANRDFSIIQSLRGSVPDAAIQALELILTHVYDLNDRVNLLPRVDTKPQTIDQIEAAIQSRKKVNLTQFLGVLAQPQNAAVPEVTVLPDANDPLSQDGGLVRMEGVLYVFDGVPEPGSWMALVSAGVIQDTRANRTNYDPADYDNFLYYETNTTLWYLSNGTVWLYNDGTYGLAQAAIAAFEATLTADDTNLRVDVTDYTHILKWGGTVFGPTWGLGNPMPSGGYHLYEDAPAGDGANAWQICDGSAVDRLNPNGSVTSVTVPNVGTAAYIKAGTTSAAVAAASGAVADTAATNQPASLNAVTQAVAAGAGETVIESLDDPHNHTQDAHNHAAGTLELRNKQARMYYRR